MNSNLIYNVCKRTIQRGNAPVDMAERLKVFYNKNKLTAAQYNELYDLL